MSAKKNTQPGGAINRPSTPPHATHGTHLDCDSHAGAPLRPNPGRIDANGNITVTVTTHEGNGHIEGAVESPSARRSLVFGTGRNVTPFEGSPPWLGPAPVGGQLARVEDPFVMNRLVGLSAAAPVFNPSMSHNPWNQPPPQARDVTGSSGSRQHEFFPSTSGTLSPTHPGAHRRSSGSSSREGQHCTDDGPVIVDGSASKPQPEQATRADPAPVLESTRFLQVENVQVDDFHPQMLFGRVKALHCFKEDVQKNGIFCIKPAEADTVSVLMFCDSKSTASTLHSKLKHGFRDTKFINQQEFEAAEIEIPDEIDRFSGDVILTVTVKETSLDALLGPNAITDMANTAAAKFGKILSFKLLYHNGGRGWTPTAARYQVEYDSAKDACDATLNTNTASGTCPPHAQAEHIEIRAQALSVHNLRRQSPRQGGTGYEFSGTGRTGTRLGAKGHFATTSGYSKLATMPSPASRVQPESAGFGGAQIFEAFDPISGGYMQTWDGQLHPNISRPQDVIDQRIEDGSDCRTTLMIRNFPPEFSGQNLIDLLNSVCPGKYDFAYNRIDFRQNQSVGYGFVNFISASWLLVFVKACRGKLLHHNVQRRHMKPCAVSYANVQGFECLVAKFRNSSILEEAEGCRPKLFWSDETAPSSGMVGQQRSWPHVDNDSKKARSMENAQTLGLYTPRRTNGGRGGRMGRFSRYDRGTSAQQNDEQFNSNYNVAANATMVPFGHVPRYQPQMLFDPRTQQFVPAAMSFQAPIAPYAGPQVAGSMLRSHTNGQLGYTQPVMPAQVAPVSSPSQGLTATQDEFAPLLYPQKGQVQKYYRRV